MHTDGELRAISAMNTSDLKRVAYISDIIDFYPTARDAAVAICHVITGIENVKDKTILDRENTIKYLATYSPSHSPTGAVKVAQRGAQAAAMGIAR